MIWQTDADWVIHTGGLPLQSEIAKETEWIAKLRTVLKFVVLYRIGERFFWL